MNGLAARPAHAEESGPAPIAAPEQVEAFLDSAAFSYEWDDLADHLVALNAERAAEEAQGHIRWLRPDYQAPEATQTSATLDAKPEATADTPTEPAKKPTWPKSMPDQVEAVRRLLAIGPQTPEALASHFKHKPTKSIAQVLAALEVLGQATQESGAWYLT